MTMEIKTLLAEWRKIKPEMVERTSIKTDDAYQPRNDRLPPFKDQGRMRETSQRHTDTLTGKLGNGRNLAPVLIARIDGQLFLIDGHHRLDAYRRAKRDSIPARIRDSTGQEAIRASLAVNCDFVKLPMHPEQCREAAWQYIAMLTNQGKCELPQGISRRDIASIFGTTHDTTARMVKQLEHVNLANYTPEACHPGTGWPHWKYVKGNAWRDVNDDVPQETRDKHRAERLAIKYGKDIEKFGFDIFKRAVELLAEEVKDERLEAIKWCDEQGWDF